MKCRWLIACGLFALSVPIAGALAQGGEASGRITGVVTTADGGQPLANVQVVVVGTQAGSVTRDDGRYTISVQPGTYRLRINRIGFAPDSATNVVVTAGGTATVDFKLNQQAVVLQQTVVVGYGSQAKQDVTGSVGSVKAEQIAQVPTTNPIEAIKGRVPGVDIITTGYKPGDGVRVRIRGQRSLKASNDPLYVLDGIPIAGGIGDLNPSDIESIDVLKDASATAIYGSRGANGVVLLTTKRGKSGRTKVTYDGYTAMQNALRDVRMMNGEEFAQFKREAYKTVGIYKCNDPAAIKCAEGDSVLRARNYFTPNEWASIQNGTWTNWQDLVLRNGSQNSHQIGVTGGNDRTQFAVSGNLVQQNGIILGQDYNRKSMRLNVETQANSRLRFGGSAMLTRSLQNLGRGDGVYGEALSNNPLGPAYDTTGALIFKPTPDGQRVNPLSDVANHQDERARTRAFGTLFASLNLVEGLDWRVNFGPDLTYARRGQFRGAETQAKQGSGSDALIEEDRTFDYTLDNIVTFKKQLGSDHRFDNTFLYSIEKQTQEEHNSSVNGLPYEHQEFYNIGSANTIESVSSRLREWALQSFMGRINYAFKDRYLLTVTSRFDGSSRLAPGHKWAVFPSVALGWRVIDEPFLRNSNLVSNLKLRSSYGRSGNTAVDPYATQGGLSRTTYAFGDVAGYGYRPGSMPNPNLEWEKTDQVDVGLEWGLFRDRLSGTVDVYRAWTHDLLMDRQLPPTTGFASITENIGETQNDGLELALSTVVLDGWKGVRWTTDFAYSVAKNKITRLYGGTNDDIGNRWFIGQPINGGNNSVYYDYKFAGIWQLADSLEAKKYAQVPGQIRVADLDGDGKITAADKTIIGNTYPSWTGSVNTRLDWKRLDFSAMAITRQHYMVENEFRTSNSTMAGRYNNILVNYWTPTNPSNSDPRPNADQENPIYGGTRAYEDGSYVKIRNITLGFTVPEGLARRAGAETLRLYATAQDPVMFTKFRGLDPEGRTSAGSPSYRSLLMGASVGF
jgi:TonB-linked SusC/RagA family outer membrane protein